MVSVACKGGGRRYNDSTFQFLSGVYAGVIFQQDLGRAHDFKVDLASDIHGRWFPLTKELFLSHLVPFFLAMFVFI